MNLKKVYNPYLLFSPFLIFYVLLVFVLHTRVNEGDEGKYLEYAQNLINGFYSPQPPDIEIITGPGYPIFLVPFVALHLPRICITLMNAVFQYLSVILLFKALQQFVSFRKALIFSLFWGCYCNLFEYLHTITSETFSIFLISLILFCLLKSFSSDNSRETKKFICLSGFTIGYLALTKIIFGYVLLLMLVGVGVFWIINRHVGNYRKAFFILLVAFLTILPYLIYTYNLSGRIFFWASTGGDNLYWMSTPYKGEYGDWANYPAMQKDSDYLMNISQQTCKTKFLSLEKRANRIPSNRDSIIKNHKKDFEVIYKNKGIEQDDAFRRIAIHNIKSHPVKYLKNCFSNIGRILFNYPYSYALQKNTTLLRLPLNGIIVVLTIFSIIPTFLNWRRIIFPIRFMLFFILLYLGGSILGSAETRMFTVIVPILLLWIAYVIQRSMKINIRFDKRE